MSQDDTKSGLLSKLVKFVRNPGGRWSDGDATQASKDDLVNKQLLKEMMERKRRNDFVRKREFDMLRAIRQREAAEGRGKEPDAGRPSFFQSSMLSPDDRASTLKKIDEIEAQMSMQWWKKERQSGDDEAQFRVASACPDRVGVRPNKAGASTDTAYSPSASAGNAKRKVSGLSDHAPIPAGLGRTQGCRVETGGCCGQASC